MPQSFTSRRFALQAIAAAALAPALARAGDEILVGQVNSQSGTNGAELGVGLRRGVEACFAMVNASGGVHGRRLRLISEDDAYDPAETVRRTAAMLAASNPVALIGYRGTATTTALVKSGLLQEYGVTLVGTLTGASELQGAPGVLHLRSSYELELTQLVAQLGRMTFQRIGLLYVNDAFGQVGRDAVVRAAQRQGLTLSAVATYDKAPDKVAGSLASAVDRLAASPAQCVIAVAVGDPFYTFVSVMRTKSPSIQLFGMSVVDPKEVVRRCGLAMAAGVGFNQVFPSPFSERTGLSRAHHEAMSKLPGSPPSSYFSMEGYVYARVLVEALRSADGFTAPRVTAALEHLAPIDLGGMAIKVDPVTRNGAHFTDLCVLDGHGRLLA